MSMNGDGYGNEAGRARLSGSVAYQEWGKSVVVPW